jgi:Domain of unknown function (DUF4249)
MRTPYIISALTIFALTATLSCKQTYDPPAIASPPTFLVVEGFINNGPDSTYFDITHTYKLSDSTTTTPEAGASVSIQGNDNSTYALGEVGNGLYGANLPALNTTATYRLYITTTGGKQYASDFVPIIVNPPIDSVNFIRKSDGVSIYVNTHDPANRAQYYRWEYQETWEFHSAYFATLQFQNNQLIPYSPNTENTCWKSDNSTRLILGTTTQLSSDVIYELPLLSIPLAAQQLSVEYSIFVKQYAITQQAYNWWSIMQNNTENIGSIFGVQPSTDQGNLHCLSDTTEQVIGFVSAGNVRSQRLFITNDQVTPWIYEPPCSIQLHSPDIDSVAFYYGEGIWPIELTPDQTQVEESYKSCIDCTLSGTNTQPPFWQ